MPRDERSVLLKAAVTGLTFAAAVAAAVYVGGHVKNAAAPLHPVVVGGSATRAAGGRLSLSSSVRSADVDTVTSTYAS